MKDQWKHKIFNIQGNAFQGLALELFHFQYANNSVYKEYTDALQVAPSRVSSIAEIPFMPIRFFKSHRIRTTAFEPELHFESSGTTGSVNSLHDIKESDLYRESFNKAFELFYGAPSDWCILGLLPSYLERNNSSLVFMVNELISQSGHSGSGFYLDEFDRLAAVLEELERKKQKTLLIGVTFALLDFAEKYLSAPGRAPLQHTIIMETGGMKGRKEEKLRPEVHAILKKAFGTAVIHSEYGMTELLSQAYSKGEGVFQSPPWMKILVRDEEDPLHIHYPVNKEAISGAINVIDLANVYSCSFIATEDAGRVFADGSFEIIGRMDNSDLRGCSLLFV